MTTMQTSISDPTEAVARIGPLIRQYAGQSEAGASLARPLVDAIIEAGLFRRLAPASLGGAEVPIGQWFRTVEAAARIDGSVGWCLFINGSTGFVGRLLSEADAEEIVGAPSTVIAGALFPFTPAEAVDGGYRVSGRWPFVSGSKHASHVITFCHVQQDGQPRMGPMGPEIRIMLVPISQVKIVDTWDVVGLCATGSNDIVLDDVLVPEAYAMPLLAGPPSRHYQGALYRLPFMALFAWPIAAVALGIAQHAIDILTDLAATKVPAGPPAAGAPAHLAARPVFQLQLADAVASVRSARAWVFEALAGLEAIAETGARAGLPERANAQLAMSNAVRNARNAVDTMFLAGGGTAVYRKNELQRCMRDIHALSQHVVTGPASWEQAGAILAGGPPQNPLLML